MADLLTKDQAELVRRKNLENIVRKVSAGKTLTRAEVDLLDTVAANQGAKAEPKKPRPAKSWTALAKAVGVSRKTIWHLRDHEGGPATLEIEPWQKFLEERANQNENHSNAENAADEIKSIRVKLLRAQAGKEEAMRKLRELELERVKEGLVPISEAKQVIRQTLGPLRGLLDSLPKAVAVQANPVEPELAEEAVRHGLDKVFEGIARELKA